MYQISFDNLLLYLNLALVVFAGKWDKLNGINQLNLFFFMLSVHLLNLALLSPGLWECERNHLWRPSPLLELTVPQGTKRKQYLLLTRDLSSYVYCCFGFWKLIIQLLNHQPPKKNINQYIICWDVGGLKRKMDGFAVCEIKTPTRFIDACGRDQRNA